MYVIHPSYHAISYHIIYMHPDIPRSAMTHPSSRCDVLWCGLFHPSSGFWVSPFSLSLSHIYSLSISQSIIHTTRPPLAETPERGPRTEHHEPAQTRKPEGRGKSATVHVFLSFSLSLLALHVGLRLVCTFT